MKNLLKFLSPFAPDQSGASAVLFELNGIIVICDAGGCAGNVCGFDEPRWFTQKSAIFSAGLRDMDAILGRDDRLIDKLNDAVKTGKYEFTAIIGTPVPAVIGTDFKALKRMAEKKTGIPAISIATNGADLYDDGEEMAWLELFKTFTSDNVMPYLSDKESGNGRYAKKIGVLGATPFEISDTDSERLLKNLKSELFSNEEVEFVCYGMGAGINEIRHSENVERNIVIAPAAIKCAQYLKDKFGTPYQSFYPVPEEDLLKIYADVYEHLPERVLIIHEQIYANSLRTKLAEHLSGKSKEGNKTEIDVASFFMMNESLMEKGDFHINDEDDLIEKTLSRYGMIIVDSDCNRALKNSGAELVNLTHFAVSGRLNQPDGINAWERRE